MRINRVLTVGDDPLNVLTGEADAIDQSTEPVYADRVLIQMVTGGSGIGYVMDGVPLGHVPDASVDDDITSELSASDGTGPGGSYSDADGNGGSPIDLRLLWVDGANAGDKIRFTARLRT